MDHGKEEMEKEVRQQVVEILNGFASRPVERQLSARSEIDPGRNSNSPHFNFGRRQQGRRCLSPRRQGIKFRIFFLKSSQLYISANFLILGEIGTFGTGNGRAHDAGR